MKILLMNTYDWGGAATATRRIHQGLQRINVDSHILVMRKRSDDSHIIGPGGAVRSAVSVAKTFSDTWPLAPFGEHSGAFSVNWMPSRVHRRIEKMDPDVVHLNWVGDNFVNPGAIAKFDCPVVWRLPDMWAFTGGCHYSDGCDRFTEQCGSCPRLERTVSRDVTRWTHRRKQKAWADVDMTVVAPCTWLADQAGRSSLFEDKRINVIPNGLDTTLFSPYDKQMARDVFDLHLDSKIVLFGAVGPTSDPRKGFEYLQSALHTFRDRRGEQNVRVVVFGASTPEEPPNLGFPSEYVGYLNDEESLALLYSAADVMIVPSKYEGFGQTVTEAMSSGTPVVAFNATGPSDTVNHEETGYLAEPYDPDDLARGIEWVLEDETRLEDLSESARERALEYYDLKTVARNYRDLYETIM